jgi:hypothetical protein
LPYVTLIRETENSMARSSGRAFFYPSIFTITDNFGKVLSVPAVIVPSAFLFKKRLILF